MGKLGGKRPGAGRPKGVSNVLQSQAKDELIKIVVKKWRPLVRAKIDLALGDYYFEENRIGDNGKPIRVYKAKPSGGDINDLLQFVAGKPTQPIELDDPGSGEVADAVRDVGSMVAEILQGRKKE